MNEDYKLEFLVGPETKIKFRHGIHTYRCQDNELLIGKNVFSTNEIVFPTVKLSSKDGAYIPETQVRLSLVDVRSTPDNVKEHYHKLIDCKDCKRPGLSWNITKVLQPGSNIVTFDNLGIVRTKGPDQIQAISERLLERRRESGDTVSGTWDMNRIRDLAADSVLETSDKELRLCIEAYVFQEDGSILELARILSSIVQDMTDANGSITIRKRNICSDSVSGGAELMLFLGGGSEKVNFKNHQFYAIFYQINEDSKDESTELVWKKRIFIPEDQLHKVNTNCAGMHLKVPVYDMGKSKNVPADISAPTQNTFFKIEKTKVGGGAVVAESSRLAFQFNPLPDLLRSRKRPRLDVLALAEPSFSGPPKETFSPPKQTLSPSRQIPSTATYDNKTTIFARRAEPLVPSLNINPSSPNQLVGSPTRIPTSRNLATASHNVSGTSPLRSAASSMDSTSSFSWNITSQPELPVILETHQPLPDFHNISPHQPPSFSSPRSLLVEPRIIPGASSPSLLRLQPYSMHQASPETHESMFSQPHTSQTSLSSASATYLTMSYLDTFSNFDPTSDLHDIDTSAILTFHDVDVNTFLSVQTDSVGSQKKVSKVSKDTKNKTESKKVKEEEQRPRRSPRKPANSEL